MYIAFTHPADHETRIRKVNSYKEASEVLAALMEMGINPEITTIDAIKTATATALPLIVNPWKPNEVKIIK